MSFEMLDPAANNDCLLTTKFSNYVRMGSVGISQGKGKIPADHPDHFELPANDNSKWECKKKEDRGGGIDVGLLGSEKRLSFLTFVR